MRSSPASGSFQEPPSPPRASDLLLSFQFRKKIPRKTGKGSGYIFPVHEISHDPENFSKIFFKNFYNPPPYPYPPITFPSLPISTIFSAVTRKNRHVPYLDRSQSSHETAVSWATERSRRIFSSHSRAISARSIRICSVYFTLIKADGFVPVIVKSYSISGPRSAICTVPRTFAIGIASARVWCARGPRLMRHAPAPVSRPWPVDPDDAPDWKQICNPYDRRE